MIQTMAEPNFHKAQPPLVDDILQYGKQAFDPGSSEETRKSSVTKFNNLLNG